MYRSDKQFMKNPATAAARIYIGSLADGVIAADLEERFKSHGVILGLVLQRGFGFIQYETEAQAQVAIRNENNQMFHGRKLNVKQALDKGRGSNQGGALQGMSSNFDKPTPMFEKPSGGPPSLLQQMVIPPKQLHHSEAHDEMMDTEPIHDEMADKQDLENDPFQSDAEDEVDDRQNRNRRGARPMMKGGRGRRDEFIPRDIPAHRGDVPFRGRGDRERSESLHRDRSDALHRDRPDILHRDRPDALLRDRPDALLRDRPDALLRDRPDALLHDRPDALLRDRPDALLRDRPDALLRDRPEGFLRDRGDLLHRDRGDAPPFFPRDDHFRERPAPVFVPPPVIDRPERNDCEIIVVAKALTEYAEFIEQKLKGLGLVVDLLFPNEDVPIGRVLANISSRGCLYAILVMPQNEEFRSLTLNILHGIPQEHRNMPIEDSLVLINRNFDAYMRGEKQGAAPPGSVAAMLTERHPEPIQMLFNLLAENRQIITPQYDKLIKYLQERRDLQSQYEVAESGAELNAEGEPNIKQVELQNRIMNILNKSADEPVKPVEIMPVAQPAGPTPLLNDPSVQKALDSLLSGDMFKSISTGGF